MEICWPEFSAEELEATMPEIHSAIATALPGAGQQADRGRQALTLHSRQDFGPQVPREVVWGDPSPL